MPTIALIDDRAADRKSLVRNFKLGLPKNWACEAIEPLQDPRKYAAWLAQFKVCVLAIDWRLDEQGAEHPVTYQGLTVVEEFGGTTPTCPSL